MINGKKKLKKLIFKIFRTFYQRLMLYKVVLVNKQNFSQNLSFLNDIKPQNSLKIMTFIT